MIISIFLSGLLSLVPGDKIVWGDNSQCRGLVLEVHGKLLKVQGICQVPFGRDNNGKINYVPFSVKGSISVSDVKGYDNAN